MNQAAKNLRTKSGKLLHPVGIGTWGFGEYPLFSPGTSSEVAAIQYAISLGQNHIDTAEMYAKGGAEQVVSQAIAPLNRKDLFIASKLWKNHVTEGTVRPAVEAMLKRLGTDYLDMLYIHAPWFDAPWQEAIPQINALIDEGVVRHLGISNFNAVKLQELLNLTHHPVAANQMHYSVVHQLEVSEELRKLCSDNKIEIIAYMPLEKGDLLKQPSLVTVAGKYGATPAQVALVWLLNQGAIPIPRSRKAEHIKQNAQAGKIELDPEDLELLNQFV